MKAANLIHRTLRIMRVVGADDAPDAEASRDALDILNGLLAEWRGSGIAVPDYDVADADTEMTIDMADRDAVAYQMALRLSPEFAKAIGPAQQQAMDESFSRFRLRYFQPGTSDLRELPVPTGRWWGYNVEIDY